MPTYLKPISSIQENEFVNFKKTLQDLQNLYRFIDNGGFNESSIANEILPFLVFNPDWKFFNSQFVNTIFYKSFVPYNNGFTSISFYISKFIKCNIQTSALLSDNSFYNCEILSSNFQSDSIKNWNSDETIFADNYFEGISGSSFSLSFTNKSEFSNNVIRGFFSFSSNLENSIIKNCSFKDCQLDFNLTESVIQNCQFINCVISNFGGLSDEEIIIAATVVGSEPIFLDYYEFTLPSGRTARIFKNGNKEII
jgi:hypothetical protein